MPAFPIHHDWRHPGGKGLADWRGWLPAALELVLVLALAGQAARLLWLVVTPTGPIGQPAGTNAAISDAPRLPVADVFFRQAAAPSSRGSGEALGYRLFGVRSEPGDGGSAILGKEGEQASYAVGGEVAPGVVLEAVGAEHAVLVANGARHRLELPRLAPMQAGGAAPATLPVGAPRPAPVKTPAANAPTSPTTSAPPAMPGQSSPPARLVADPDGGYEITAGASAALLRTAGLRPGDVVLSVNGRPLDPARLAGLQDELKGQSRLSIQYQRDGKTHTTTLQAPR